MNKKDSKMINALKQFLNDEIAQPEADRFVAKRIYQNKKDFIGSPQGRNKAHRNGVKWLLGMT